MGKPVKRKRKAKAPRKRRGPKTGGRTSKLTEEKKVEFLKVLTTTANVSAASKAIGFARQSLYDIRRSDPAFAARWADAAEEGVDMLEQECRRRAMLGTNRPVYQGGQLVGHVKDYSDTLAIFLLKGHRPEKYRDRWQVDHKHSGQVNHAVLQAVILEPGNAELAARLEESVSRGLIDAGGNGQMGHERNVANGEAPRALESGANGSERRAD